jgi:predicted PurR-regulated permease PerM
MRNNAPNPTGRPASERSAGASLRDRASGIIAFAIVLSLLYLGRDVLIPLTLALMLSLLIAPLVRLLRRIRLGQTPAVLVAVLVLALSLSAIGAAVGTQVLRMAASLPQYQDTIQHKLQNLDEMTVGRLNTLTSEASRLIDRRRTAVASSATAPADAQPGFPATGSPIPVELHAPPADPLQIIQKVLASVWVPIETTGIVLIVMVFVLLEHESLRDRIIRIAGGTHIRLTTLALNDAGERLSRFFVSQFAVNLGVGAAIGLGLAILGLPHAMLWGALAAMLRFVPYVGVWIAAIFSTALALAVVPGWSLAVSTLGLFVLVEVIAGQIVEPQLYGHTTGLSPLSVVVAAIFWSSLWGPVGLILSTPLTLCLLVLGRHIEALSFLDLLLGDTQALTLPQKFYQRALSGDSHEIIANARDFLKRNSLAAYCDLVLMPALHLGRLDYEIGVISDSQQIKIRDVIVTVISALGRERPNPSRRRQGASVLDHVSSGRTLRQYREQLTGRWQGPLAVPPGSVMVCIGMGSTADDLATELLVRVLLEYKQDARHFSIEDVNVELPPDATPGGVAIVYLVSAFAETEGGRHEGVVERVRKLAPGALLVDVLLPGVSAHPQSPGQTADTDHAVSSFVQALQICIERQQERQAGVETLVKSNPEL